MCGIGKLCAESVDERRAITGTEPVIDIHNGDTGGTTV